MEEFVNPTIHHEVALTNNRAAELWRLRDHSNANFVSIESYLAWMPPDDLLEIFRAIGKLSSLRTFRISFSFQRFRQLPVLPIPSQALASVLDSSNTADSSNAIEQSTLESLTLDEVTFSFRGPNDWISLAKVLKRASGLKLVTLFNCFPLRPVETFDTNANGSTEECHLFDTLAKALSDIRNLQELNLIYTREGPEWIQALLQHVCTSRSMKILRINVHDFSFVGDPIQQMCQALQSNTTLRELSIRCPLDADGAAYLADALNGSKSDCRLEELYIQLKNYAYAIPIAEALHTNKNMTWFELRVWTGGDRNPLLKALERMLIDNTCMQSITIDNGRLGLTLSIDFYLALNKSGRKKLLEGGDKLTKEVWVDYLVGWSSNLSGLFYVLSLNPSLCEQNGKIMKEDNVTVSAPDFNMGNQGRRKRLRSV